MKTNLNQNKNLNIVAAYEDFLAGVSVKDLCQTLASRIGLECNLGDNLWRFDILEIPEVKVPAASQAANADMLIISTYEDRPFPNHMKSWVELWIEEKKTGSGTLIVLLNQKQKLTKASGEAWDYLRNVAEKANLTFFTQSMPIRGSEVNA